MLEHRPHHERKTIALAITIGVAVVLVALLVFIYTTKEVAHTDSGAQIKDFYTTIRQTGQSLFEGK